MYPHGHSSFSDLSRLHIYCSALMPKTCLLHLSPLELTNTMMESDKIASLSSWVLVALYAKTCFSFAHSGIDRQPWRQIVHHSRIRLLLLIAD